jgi:hypothetical protein
MSKVPLSELIRLEAGGGGTQSTRLMSLLTDESVDIAGSSPIRFCVFSVYFILVVNTSVEAVNDQILPCKARVPLGTHQYPSWQRLCDFLKSQIREMLIARPFFLCIIIQSWLIRKDSSRRWRGSMRGEVAPPHSRAPGLALVRKWRTWRMMIRRTEQEQRNEQDVPRGRGGGLHQRKRIPCTFSVLALHRSESPVLSHPVGLCLPPRTLQ